MMEEQEPWAKEYTDEEDRIMQRFRENQHPTHIQQNLKIIELLKDIKHITRIIIAILGAITGLLFYIATHP